MIKNYLVVAIRNLFRHKTFSLINILGLVIGMVCVILIGLWINDELSFDKFNENYDQIYRIGTDSKMGEQEGTGSFTSHVLAPTLMAEIPEIEKAARLRGKYEKLATYDKTNILLKNIYYSDPELFDIFTIPLVAGSKSDLLTKPRTIVISNAVARKFFPNEDAIGKSLTFDNTIEMEIVGITQDLPANSHWDFEVLIAYAGTRAATDENWLNNSPRTYIKVQPGTDPALLTTKINELFVRKTDDLFKQILGVTFAEWVAQGNHYNFRLTPLAAIYLFNPQDEAVERKGDIRYVELFAIIGFFILLVACVNFMNLTTARSAVRAKEIGMRKVLGSNRKQLIWQFLCESIIISLFALLIALICSELLLFSFNEFTGKHLDLKFAGDYSYPLYFALAIFIGLISGIYSAVTLSSYRVLSILKGSLFKGKQRSGFRNTLVLFQFAISIIVILCTIITLQQMHYISNKELGFNKDQLLVIERAYILDDQLPVYKEEISKLAAVKSASAVFSVPGSCSDGSMFNKDNNTPDELHHFYRLCGDYDYLETMGFELAEGRYFSPEFASDKSAIIINEAAVKELGYENPLGRFILEPDSAEKLTIIGVVKDFHNNSFRDEITPMMIFHPDIWYKELMAVRIDSENEAGTIQMLEENWHKLAGEQPFEYFFMDNYFDNLHRSEQMSGKFFTIFAILAIFIACLGLFGLAAFTAEQKTKEIGVRKVMGATVSNIASILVMQFIKWIILANLIAWPVGYFVMKTWLQNFAYHINLNIGYFLLSGIMTLLIAVVTVSYLVVNAANRNPVEALKYE
ncbi:MAG TPA: ABC transporter permease [Candidatus Cloacimonadota bacterium]|nr:ABC transporter permease [Candidatus Cloacimonadota bacterium]